MTCNSSQVVTSLTRRRLLQERPEWHRPGVLTWHQGWPHLRMATGAKGRAKWTDDLRPFTSLLLPSGLIPRNDRHHYPVHVLICSARCPGETHA